MPKEGETFWICSFAFLLSLLFLFLTFIFIFQSVPSFISMTVDEQYDLGASTEANNANDMKSAEVQKRFKAFQRSYLVVYLTVMGKVEQQSHRTLF